MQVKLERSFLFAWLATEATRGRAGNHRDRCNLGLGV